MYRRLVIWLFFFINLAVIAGFWWRGSGELFFSPQPGMILIAFGRLAGLVAMYSILVMLILISRLSFVEKAYGFDKLNKLHRGLGYGIGAGIISHPLLLVLGYSMAGKVSLYDQLQEFLLGYEDVLLALVGLCLLLGAVVISLPWIRKKLKYETWRVGHLVMYLAIGLLFGHQTKSGDISYGSGYYYWLALSYTVFGSVLVYRFARPFWVFSRHRFVIEKVVSETPNVASVYISGRNMEAFRFEAGQYVVVTFLTRGFLQPHPFSLSQAYNGRHIRLSIKNSGDFTSKIKALRPGTRVLVEGPLGRFTEAAAVTPMALTPGVAGRKYLFIAGGIGITPIRSMVESLSGKNDLTLIYGNKSVPEIALGQELSGLGVRVHHVLSDQVVPGYLGGRVDMEKIKALVPDFAERDIYVCGPPPMMFAIVRALKAAKVPKPQIHFEQFSY